MTNPINILWHNFLNDHTGFCGHGEPARILAKIPDQERRLSILTFSCLLTSPDYSKLLAHQNSWLFQPQIIANKRSQEVQAELNETGIRAPKYIPRTWWQILRGVQGRFKGSWIALLASLKNDAIATQTYLQDSKATFPVLSGDVTSAFWLDIVHRLGDIPLHQWDKLKVPLGEKEKSAAQVWGSNPETIHPSLRLALQHWQKSCKRLPSCKLRACPGKI